MSLTLDHYAHQSSSPPFRLATYSKRPACLPHVQYFRTRCRCILTICLFFCRVLVLVTWVMRLVYQFLKTATRTHCIRVHSYTYIHWMVSLSPNIDISVSSYCLQQLLALGDRIGDARAGLTQTQIARLPTKQFVRPAADGASAAAAASSETLECSICFCEYAGGEELRMLPCFHEFHSHCIDKWITVCIFEDNSDK